MLRFSVSNQFGYHFITVQSAVGSPSSSHNQVPGILSLIFNVNRTSELQFLGASGVVKLSFLCPVLP